jgi:predicted  nucleic acid-binding Zn-ribbon protein
VDLSNLSPNQLFAAVGVLSFIFGMALMCVVNRANSSTSDAEDPRNHYIRGLEADLRTAHRQMAENGTVQTSQADELGMVVGNNQNLQQRLTAIEDEVTKLQQELRKESLKVRELRQQLQDRATETIREHVRAEEATTELEVARAGSEAVVSEINRLQEERKCLTSTMRQLEDSMLADNRSHKDTLA